MFGADIFQCRYHVMTSKNGADFVQFVTPALAPASQIGQSRAYELKGKTFDAEKICGDEQSGVHDRDALATRW